MYDNLLANLAILVLAGFVGFAVISKVPNTLHTPLMSGSNFIHGVVLVGSLLMAMIFIPALGALWGRPDSHSKEEQRRIAAAAPQERPHTARPEDDA